MPFSFDLQVTPVMQNEERVMCGDKLYLSAPRWTKIRQHLPFNEEEQISLVKK